jgi:hypothetical protein
MAPATSRDSEPAKIRSEAKLAQEALAEAARHMASAAAADTDDETKQDPELQLLKDEVIDLHQQTVVFNTRLSDERV